MQKQYCLKLFLCHKLCYTSKIIYHIKTFINIPCVLWEILRVKSFHFLGLTAIRKDFKIYNFGELLSSIKGIFSVNLRKFY